MEKGKCPVCGKENGCGMLKGTPHEECWCTKVKFEKEMLEVIPEKYKGLSCICLKCIGDFQVNKEFKKMYDLHLHTTVSDGTYTPYELVKLAKEKELKGIAVTDHDTVFGIKDAVEAGKEMGIEIIPGIEFSSNLNGEDVHILGYFINTEDPFFLERLKKINGVRTERNLKILENLEKYKIKITMEELIAEAKGHIVSKLHIANVMRNKGFVYTKEEAFKSYLGKSGVAHINHGNFTPHRAVEILKENGAFISLAHPKLYSRDINKIEKLIVELKPLGLSGIEVEYPGFTKEEKKQYMELARKYDLAVTGGSDFHGENRNHIDIGDEGITYSQMQDIKIRMK